ncbi:hypothetical protein EVAR_49746_1 [Eumeta japonica]|uniref:Uncharacterized protein n=1 Tax=Eumeta variegata TaxID=151549 RepID=A0A4C1YCR8_EUMVA|nr:hypothetical protein EVAR_49746_1 [Eumeta japonica]
MPYYTTNGRKLDLWPTLTSNHQIFLEAILLKERSVVEYGPNLVTKKDVLYVLEVPEVEAHLTSVSFKCVAWKCTEADDPGTLQICNGITETPWMDEDPSDIPFLHKVFVAHFFLHQISYSYLIGRQRNSDLFRISKNVRIGFVSWNTTKVWISGEPAPARSDSPQLRSPGLIFTVEVAWPFAQIKPAASTNENKFRTSL